MSPIIGSFTGSISFNRAKPPQSFIVASGGDTVTDLNGWTIHTFTTTGSNTFEIADAPPGATIDFLLVGGGGAGGNGLSGGGGGGGVIQEYSYPAQAGTYTIDIATASVRGTYGAFTNLPNNRGNSSTLTTPGGTAITALGGGCGGWWDGNRGSDGASGGGSPGSSSPSNTSRIAGGTGTLGQGSPAGHGIRYPEHNYNSADAFANSDTHSGSGGGGAGGAGMWYTSYDDAGAGNMSRGKRGGRANVGAADGGSGQLSTIDGTVRYFGGGGGGACWLGNAWAGNGGRGGGGGGNHQANSGFWGAGGGSSFNAGENGQHGTRGGDAGANTGGGGGGSYGDPWSGGPGGAGGSGVFIVRYRSKINGDGDGLPAGNLGLTELTAAESALAIKQAWSSAPDGTYWIQPNGAPEAYKVFCYMTIEGGGWELAYRINSWNFGNSATQFGGPSWNGWNYTTKAECDTHGKYYERHGDEDCISPSFCYRDFTDVMVIANQHDDLRAGYRFGTTQTSISANLSTAGSKTTSTALFPASNAFNWPLILHERSGTNMNYAGGEYFGFKVRFDNWASNSNNPILKGGNASNYGTNGWGQSQIGIGRDNNSTPGYWGGGFGAASYNVSPYETVGGGPNRRMNGHWWGHGDGRNRFCWTGDRSNGYYGHSIFVRKSAP